jgi:hypothetical protein
MAITATHVHSYSAGNTKHRMYDLTFTGSYQDDGSTSTLVPSDVGLKRIYGIFTQSGVAAATALTTANEYAITLNSGGTSAEVTFYENAAAGSPSAEKTDNEAFITGQTVRVLIIGY